MITPHEIRQKAKRQYSKFRKAWLKGESFFPYQLPSSKKTGDNLTLAIQSTQQLKKASKEETGYGYRVEWVERKHRIHGFNKFANRISIETEDDFLRLIGKKKEFLQFSAAVDKVRQQYPALIEWIQFNLMKFDAVAAKVDDLLKVVDYFHNNPRPNLFVRELPLPVNTKFIEENKKILTLWFNQLLPPESISASEQHFERRYGLKYAEQHILVRFLDLEVQKTFGSPWKECSVPIHTLAEMQVVVKNVIVVENKVNLLTLPSIKGTLAIGGLGNAVTDLQTINWLHSSSIWYWGDIDVDGLSILSRFRLCFPQTISLMMDKQAIDRWANSIGQKITNRKIKYPSELTDSENKAFDFCLNNHLRIEQEQIPQIDVDEILSNLF